MSYQFELPRVPGAEIGQALRERAEAWAQRATMTDDEHQAFTEHVDGIANAAEIVVSWMGHIDGEPDVRVVVTGHANPGHLPREGYSDEHITISIGVLPAEGQAVPAEPEAVVIADPRMTDALVTGAS